MVSNKLKNKFTNYTRIITNVAKTKGYNINRQKELRPMKNKPILACITAQQHCTGIIKAAKHMAQQLETELVVVTVQPLKMDAENRAKSVKLLKEISDECGVDIVIRYSDNPSASIAAQAVETEPIHIFIGEDNGFLNKLRSLYGFAPISIVANRVICTIPPELDISLKITG